MPPFSLSPDSLKSPSPEQTPASTEYVIFLNLHEIVRIDAMSKMLGYHQITHVRQARWLIIPQPALLYLLSDTSGGVLMRECRVPGLLKNFNTIEVRVVLENEGHGSCKLS